MKLTLTTITAMLYQEEKGYNVSSDFLHQENPSTKLQNGPLSPIITADTRSRIVSWMYSIADFLRLERETVEIAMNFLDRFCSSLSDRSSMDASTYQLSALTCLYTAVKIHEAAAIDLINTSRLSQGLYFPDQIEKMESQLLFALQWRLNPCTSLSFVRQYVDLIPLDVIDAETRQAAFDIAKYQTELAVREVDLISTPRSTVAYCSLLNSLESLGIDQKIVCEIGYALCQAIGAGNHNEKTLLVQACLLKLVESSNDVKFEQHRAASSKAMMRDSNASWEGDCNSPCSINYDR